MPSSRLEKELPVPARVRRTARRSPDRRRPRRSRSRASLACRARPYAGARPCRAGAKRCSRDDRSTLRPTRRASCRSSTAGSGLFSARGVVDELPEKLRVRLDVAVGKLARPRRPCTTASRKGACRAGARPRTRAACSAGAVPTPRCETSAEAPPRRRSPQSAAGESSRSEPSQRLYSVSSQNSAGCAIGEHAHGGRGRERSRSARAPARAARPPGRFRARQTPRRAGSASCGAAAAVDAIVDDVREHVAVDDVALPEERKRDRERQRAWLRGRSIMMWLEMRWCP